mmetsp:Transcript_5396/g.10834  ORF Transcript_5396/g.10834 Transcript_5396/m.10834 type:complete len:683 (+) Transcript_5396:2645-4693(+)
MLQPLKVPHGLSEVSLVAQLAVGVVHPRDATRHARAEVLANLADDDAAAARHVLQPVVPAPLDHRDSARVADGKALPRNASEERLPRGGAVQRDVAGDDVVLRLEPASQILGVRHDDNLAATQPLARAVVAVADDIHRDARRQERSERLTRTPPHVDGDGVIRQALLAVLLRDLVREDGAGGAVDVFDFRLDHDGLLALERRGGFPEQDEVVNVLLELVVLLRRVVRVGVGVHEPLELERGRQDRREVDVLRLGVPQRLVVLQKVRAAHHLVHRAHAKHRHPLPDLLPDHPQEIHHMVRHPLELLAQLGVLRRDPDRAHVEVALAHHDAPKRDQRRRREPCLLSSEQEGHHHIAPRLDLTVGLHHHARAQVVEHERLVCFCEAELPRKACALDASPLRRPRPSVVPGDEDVVSLGLGDACRHHAYAHLRDELHRHARSRVGALEVIDELGKVLDGVDVVVRRRRDEPHPRRRVPQLADVNRHLESWKLAALSWLGPLRHLDLELDGVREVVGRYTETAGGYLLDRRRADRVDDAFRRLPALSCVRLRPDLVHGDAEGLVGFLGDGAHRHGARCKPFHNLCYRLHLLNGHRRNALGVEVELTTQRDALHQLVRDRLVPAVGLAAILARSLLQQRHLLWRVVMQLPAIAVVEVAEVRQRILLISLVERAPHLHVGETGRSDVGG